jgi:hypothetical protein
MSNGDVRHNAALGGLVAWIVAMVVTGFVFYSLQLRQGIAERRNAAEKIAVAQRQGPENNLAQPEPTDIRSANAADDSVDVAYVQLLLSVFGLVGLGLTVRYARLAWKEAERSADVANRALAEASADAAEQAKRFRLQLAAAKMAARETKRSNDIAAAAQRPYLYYTGGRYQSFRVEGERLWMRVEVDLFNGGITPAYITRFAMMVWVSSLDLRGGNGGSDSYDPPKLVGIRLPHVMRSAFSTPFDATREISGNVIVGLRYGYRSESDSWPEEVWLAAEWCDAVESGELRHLNAPDDKYVADLRKLYDDAG